MLRMGHLQSTQGPPSTVHIPHGMVETPHDEDFLSYSFMLVSMPVAGCSRTMAQFNISLQLSGNMLDLQYTVACMHICSLHKSHQLRL